jgi:pyruvate dehydrogenase (quinone)
MNISIYENHITQKAFLEPEKKDTISDILVEKLIAWDVEYIFGLVGDGINPLVEAIRKRSDRIKMIGVRHEEAAAFMASGYAKTTGRLGVCLSTTGPGSLHLMNGLYDAALDGAPVLAITGTTYENVIGTSFMQEVDTVSLMKDVAIQNVLITSPRQALTVIDIACRSALSEGGVSHLSIPVNAQEKMMKDELKPAKGESIRGSSSWIAPIEVPIRENIMAAAEVLNAGKKIMILAGRGALGARDELLLLAQKLKSPIAKALLGKAVIEDDSPFTTGGIGDLGTLPSKELMQECDTLLILGSNMPYADYYPDPKNARAVQIDKSAKKIALRFPVEIGLVGDVKETIKLLLTMIEEKTDDSFLKSAQDKMIKWREKLEQVETSSNDALKPQTAVKILESFLENDAHISFDCGVHTMYGARHLKIKKDQRLTVSGTLATMAAGLPYAIAAKLAYPDRQVVALVGDGGFTMLMGEIATAVQWNLPIKVIILKNNNLGMIVKEQKDLGNTPFNTDLFPIDFDLVAKACGAESFKCNSEESMKIALKAAFKINKVAIIEVSVDSKEHGQKPDEV